MGGRGGGMAVPQPSAAALHGRPNMALQPRPGPTLKAVRRLRSGEATLRCEWLVSRRCRSAGRWGRVGEGVCAGPASRSHSPADGSATLPGAAHPRLPHLSVCGVKLRRLLLQHAAHHLQRRQALCGGVGQHAPPLHARLAADHGHPILGHLCRPRWLREDHYDTRAAPPARRGLAMGGWEAGAGAGPAAAACPHQRGGGSPGSPAPPTATATHLAAAFTASSCDTSQAQAEGSPTTASLSTSSAATAGRELRCRRSQPALRMPAGGSPLGAALRAPAWGVGGSGVVMAGGRRSARGPPGSSHRQPPHHAPKVPAALWASVTPTQCRRGTCWLRR